MPMYCADRQCVVKWAESCSKTGRIVARNRPFCIVKRAVSQIGVDAVAIISGDIGESLRQQWHRDVVIAHVWAMGGSMRGRWGKRARQVGERAVSGE